MHETCFRLLGVLTVQWANTIHKSAEALDNDTGDDDRDDESSH